MARPIQLRYNDATNGETVIGTYLTDDNLINAGMLKNSGSGEYTRLEITGDKQLQEKLETDYTNYGTARNGESEPEILVYTYEKSTGGFTLRDRVFPEDAGSIKDDGSYRNNNLWGFQKWVGRQKVTGISLSNASITTIIDNLLPSGYTAVTPTGDSVPTVENYSYTGSINGAIRDIIRDYPVKIWFTSELDANNDYKVKVESKGYGGVIQTVTWDGERQTEGYQINEFQPEDKSNIVNKVEIIGTANDGSKIQVEETDSTSINQHGERYVKRNVGYVADSAQATSLAQSILSPEPSPHAEMAIPFQEDNQLNGSVDIQDTRYGIDAVYTIVKQRDFFTEGRTEVELGFEKNRTEKRRDANRDLDERNNQLFTSQQTDVGNQTVDADTENVEDTYDVQFNQGHAHDVDGKTSTADGAGEIIQGSFFDSSFTNGLTENFQQVASLTPNQDAAGVFLYITVNKTGSGNEGAYITDVSVEHDFDDDGSKEEITQSGDALDEFPEPTLYLDNDVGGSNSNFAIFNAMIFCPFPIVNNNDIDVRMKVASNGPTSPCEVEVRFNLLGEHTHTLETETDRATATIDGAQNTVNPGDTSAGDTTSLNASGSTEDNVNVNITNENKTDR